VPSERSTSVASGSELSWWQWVDARIEACLEAHNEAVGTAMGEFCGPQVAALRRQIELLEREVTQLREQVGLERGLAALREEVEEARKEVPKLPAIAERLETGQARLQRELKRTQDRVTRVRVNQSMTDFKLDELSKATAKRAAGLEMKIETSVSAFAVGDIHPAAASALHDFAAEAINNGKTIWRFDPGPTAGAA
jgi:hypothetical protein